MYPNSFENDCRLVFLQFSSSFIKPVLKFSIFELRGPYFLARYPPFEQPAPPFEQYNYDTKIRTVEYKYIYTTLKVEGKMCIPHIS